MTAVAAIILGCILGLPSAAASSAPSEIGPASASDGCAPIIASVSPSGVIIRDGNNQRFDAKVLCGGASDITNDPATKIGWSVAGGIGNVNPRNGNGTTFNANNEGSGQVVAYVQYYELTAEARADVEVVGSGGSCQTLTVSTIPPGALVPVGQGKSFRALVRCDGNNISSSSQVGWSVVGGIGTVNPGTGQVTNFTGTAAGPGRVNAGVHYGNQNLGGHAVVVVSGSGGNNAPYVTGTVPTDGATDVLRNTTIDISFSAAMNASATEGAISSSPAITGSFSWPSTSRVVWTPGWLLTASTKYAVTVSTAAKSQAGQNLARLHLFNFTTGQNGLGAPMILSTDPADGTMNVPVNSTIIFEWSLDMQRATAEGATSSGPAISGSWTWNAGDTRATWTPGTLLQASTQYTVNVTTAATSQNGTKMAGPYSFKFTTAGPPPPPAPAVTSTDPTNNQQGVAVGAKVEVTFNLPMEIAPTEGAVSASPAIAGTFGWVLNDTKFVLTPSSPLQAGTAYTVTISSSAKSKAGATLPSPYSFKFSTAESQQVPQVVSNSPANGQQNVPVSVDIVVTFSIAMDKASVVNALSFSPAAPGTLAWSAGDTVLTVNPSADLQAAVQYTVRIDTVAKSAQGVALPSEHVFVFTTAAGDLAIPKITGTIPWDGAVGVFRNTSIVIAFDLPMEPVATEGAISASPAITGTITWGPLDLELTLDPSSDLQPLTTYQVTLGTGAKSAKGVALPSAYSFKFTTGVLDDKPPLVSHTPPPEVEEGTPIEIVATVTDDSGVASVTLLYQPAGQAGFTSAAMAPGSGSDFVFTIPSDEVKPAMVKYYIQAADTVGNAVNSPANAPDAVHSVAVRPKAGGPGPGPGGGLGGSVLIGGVSVPVVFLLLVLVVIAILAALFFMRRRRRPTVDAPPASFFDSGARVSVAQPDERVVMPETGSPSWDAPAVVDEVRPAPKSEPSLLALGIAAPPSPEAASESKSGASATGLVIAPGPVEKDETPEATAREREELKERIRARRAAKSAGNGNGNGEAP